MKASSLWDLIEKIEVKQYEQEEVQAQILLNQTEIFAKQAEQDEILAELLLQGLEI